MKYTNEFILFGSNVKSTRQSKGFSQQKLANDSFIDKRTLQRIEKGEKDMLFGSMLAIAAALGVEITFLILPIRAELKS